MSLRNKKINKQSAGVGKVQIGPDAMRFKIKDRDVPRHLKVVGKILHVGLNFVDVLQEDKCVVTVLTDKITHIRWLEQNFRNDSFLNCHPPDRICVQFDRLEDERDMINDEVREKMKRLGNNLHHCQCENCSEHFIEDCDCFDHFDSRIEHCAYGARCHQRFTCFNDFVIPFCDERIELRLAGLTDDLNFQLMQHIGCKVKLELV